MVDTNINTESYIPHSRSIMVMMLCRIHKICIENNIKYWLGFGTLLGAIRHNGFIPWDDDIDICMFREDYTRFSKVVEKELGNDYFWQSAFTEDGFPYLFGKVRLRDTIWRESNEREYSENGFFIDVFPVDYLPKSKVLSFILNKITYFAYRLYYIKVMNGKNIFAEKASIRDLIFAFFPNCFFVCIYKVISYFCSKCKNYGYSSILGFPYPVVCASTVYDSIITHKFEGHLFCIPKDYHIVLTAFYGDYMQLPPESDRVGKHNIIEVKFGEY